MNLETLKLSIPSKSSNWTDWKLFYTNIKEEFGRDDANTVFKAYWSKRGTDSANTSELRSFLKENGIQIESGTLAGAYDSAVGVIDSVGNVFKMGGYAAIAVGGILTLSVLMLIFNIAKSPVESMSAVAKLKGGN